MRGIIKNSFLGVLALLVCFFLAGCDPIANYTHYLIIMPDEKFYSYREPSDEFGKSATSEDSIAAMAKISADGSLEVTYSSNSTLKIVGMEETYCYDVYFPYDAAHHYRIRGDYLKGEQRLVWVSMDEWNSGHFCGFIDKCLVQTKLILLNLDTHDLLVNRTLGKNDLFLMGNTNSIYTYKEGNIYKRDFADWENPQEIGSIPSKNYDELLFDLSDRNMIKISSVKTWADDIKPVELLANIAVE